MALYAWQKIDYVLPGLPFGDGADGDYSSATAPTMLNDSFTGTSGNNTITTGSATYANGDILRLAEMRGTNVGQWEIVKVVSGGGTNTLTLSKNLQYTYTDSGASQAQATKIPRYRNVTVLAGTWSAPDWAGNLGGVLVFACRGTYTPTGSVSANGTGFDGGVGRVCTGENDTSYNGEGSAAGSSYNNSGDNSANGNGGGAGDRGPGGYTIGGGGGGASAVAGSNGAGDGGRYGIGGSIVGDANCNTMILGGGGGAGAGTNDGGTNAGGYGGNGGGHIIIYAKIITTPTSISANGNNGETKPDNAIQAGGGGGGGGGIILICTMIAAIGTDKLSATGGTGGSGAASGDANKGGNGGKGRVTVYYSLSLTGSVDSSLASYTSELDRTLVEPGGAAMMPDENR